MNMRYTENQHYRTSQTHNLSDLLNLPLTVTSHSSV